MFESGLDSAALIAMAQTALAMRVAEHQSSLLCFQMLLLAEDSTFPSTLTALLFDPGGCRGDSGRISSCAITRSNACSRSVRSANGLMYLSSI
jgi:hypothetical protein